MSILYTSKVFYSWVALTWPWNEGLLTVKINDLIWSENNLFLSLTLHCNSSQNLAKSQACENLFKAGFCYVAGSM